jgi:hypothetical protein
MVVTGEQVIRREPKDMGNGPSYHALAGGVPVLRSWVCFRFATDGSYREKEGSVLKRSLSIHIGQRQPKKRQHQLVDTAIQSRFHHLVCTA